MEFRPQTKVAMLTMENLVVPERCLLLATQRAKLVSNHIRYNDADSNKHGSFADSNMIDKDQASLDLGF